MNVMKYKIEHTHCSANNRCLKLQILRLAVGHDVPPAVFLYRVPYIMSSSS